MLAQETPCNLLIVCFKTSLVVYCLSRYRSSSAALPSNPAESLVFAAGTPQADGATKNSPGITDAETPVVLNTIAVPPFFLGIP
jgi:hypothetical protein